MIYRKICIVALFIIGLFIIFQGFALHKEVKEFSYSEKTIKHKWTNNPPVVCPATFYSCSLNGQLTYLKIQKDEMKRTYIYKFILLGALSVPCFVLLYKNKK